MDDQTFDRLARKLATRSSRRALLRQFAAGMAGLVVVRATAGQVQAQTCAGIQESCETLDCCEGYGCNENFICIAAAECAELGGGCLTHEQCCQGYFCDETGTCIAGAACSGFGAGCESDDDCCDDLVCNADRLCVGPSPDAGNGSGTNGETGEGESTDVTELPGTGAGGDNAARPWLASAAVAAAGAALIGGARLRPKPVPRPVPVERPTNRPIDR